MPEPIHIDLRDLTQAHVDEAMPHMGERRYRAPCIIGVLVPKRRRAALDSTGLVVSGLIAEGRVELPPRQMFAAIDLQRAFDNAQRNLFLELVKPWVEATK